MKLPASGHVEWLDLGTDSNDEVFKDLAQTYQALAALQAVLGDRHAAETSARRAKRALSRASGEADR